MLCLCINACTTQTEAPVAAPGEQRKVISKVQATGNEPLATSHEHIVKRGDTLYSIAWRYGFDYREIAAWNHIRAPYVIYPEQRLKLQAPPAKKSEPLTPGPIVRKKTPPKPAAKSAIKSETAAVEKSAKSQQAKPLPAKLSWSWPVRGKLVQRDTPTAKKGIDIMGKLGQRVNAAAMGDVVYSGSGLLGYGKLIIIKHNDTFLSAYAHNSKLLVKEGDRVKQGQQIAQMGQTTEGRTLLHFEIRKNGKPIDPLAYLPAL